VEVDPRRIYRMARGRTPQLWAADGRREQLVISRRRGKYSRPRLPCGPVNDVAFAATLRAAAARLAGSGPGGLVIEVEDLREKVRRHRSPFVIVFVLDNSWSIHVDATLERTKGVVLELLKDAATHHDRVGLVAFRHSRSPEATVCLQPTASYALAAKRLAKIRLSGSTPLPDAMRKAYHLLRQERSKYHNALPVLVLVTDGLPNIPIKPGGDPYAEVARLCQELRWEGIRVVVVDTEPGGRAAVSSNCRDMAALSNGAYLPLSRLTRRSLEEALAHRHGESAGRVAAGSPRPVQEEG
jgi:Mg-chelatase subunit ChlD